MNENPVSRKSAGVFLTRKAWEPLTEGIMKRLAFLLISISVFLGCAPSSQTVRSEPSSLQYVDGIVRRSSGNEVDFSLSLPEIQKTEDTPAAEIARQIIQKGLFIEGLQINIDGSRGIIEKIAGSSVSMRLLSAQAYAIGQNVKLEIPKKRIAIADFTVIRGGMKEAGTILMEQLSTLLIESRQFTVVERSKLNTVIEEIKLLQSGMAEEIPEEMRPRLKIADLILTGTLAEIGDKYDINLRLLNVRTGQAIAAIHTESTLFKRSQTRDSGEWNEDFEEFMTDHSWLIGPLGIPGTCFISVDRKTGAEGSKSALRMDYDFQRVKDYFCHCRNEKKRDLSLYKGVEFYIKGTEPIIGTIDVDISDRDDPNRRDRWQARFEIDNNWKVIRVAFTDLHVIQKKWIQSAGYAPGKQIMDLTQIEAVDFVTSDRYLMKPEKKGSLWIDKIRFYK
jgi:hypothetical protein